MLIHAGLPELSVGRQPVLAPVCPFPFPLSCVSCLIPAQAIPLSLSFQPSFCENGIGWLEFEQGDLVFLVNKNIRLKVDGPKKSLPRCLGPFQVLKGIGKVAYELEIPPTREVHDAFCVSLLRAYKRNRTQTISNS